MNRIFGKVVNDVSSQWAQHNLTWGIDRLVSQFDKLKLPHKIQFECSADFGVTKNEKRFKSGFAIGGILSWGNKDVAIPSLRPNCCGMIVVGLKMYPSDLVEKASVLSNKWDIANGNHFIMVGESNMPGCPYIAIFHGVSGDKKLLYKESDDLLIGDEARLYHELYLQEEAITKQKRLEFAKELFPGGEIISNTVHQGLIGKTAMAFGCYISDGETLYPFMTSSSTDSYLVQAPKGVILPHGSGYAFPQYEHVVLYATMGGKRLYRAETRNGYEIVEFPGAPYSYRDGRDVMGLVDADFKIKITPMISLKF